MEDLAHEPDMQGKPLVGDLQGYRSVRAVGQRFRIVYRTDQDNGVVRVVAIGLRKQGDKKDVYALTQKLWNRGELP